MLVTKDNRVEDSDHAKNARLLELDREFAEFFIKEAPNELVKLKQALDRNDVTELKFQAHKMIPTMLMMNNEKAAKILKLLSKPENSDMETNLMAKTAIQEIEIALSDK